MDYLGKDILLNDDFDIVYNEQVNYGRCVAQDLKKAIYKDLFPYLNNEETSIEDIKKIIIDKCYSDPRVNLDTINLSVYQEKNEVFFILSFIPLGYNTKENIVLGVNNAADK